MKHKTLLVYVPCLDGGCEDVGRIELDGRTLISDERLWDLEAAEADAVEQARLNGMGSEREAALMAKLEAAEQERDWHTERCEDAMNECDALQAKIAEMERQKPAAWMSSRNGFICKENKNPDYNAPLYALPGAQQCKNCNGMGDRFDPSGEKIPCDLCESHLEEIQSLVAEAAHDIISGSDFWLSISLAAKKIYALPGAKGE